MPGELFLLLWMASDAQKQLTDDQLANQLII